MAEDKHGTRSGQADRSRRDVLKAGALWVPTIVTLHASPAWAATDYTVTAYRYGVNAGLCRNPNFQEGSNAPWKRDEFMPCEQLSPSGEGGSGGTGGDPSDTQEIRF